MENNEEPVVESTRDESYVENTEGDQSNNGDGGIVLGMYV